MRGFSRAAARRPGGATRRVSPRSVAFRPCCRRCTARRPFTGRRRRTAAWRRRCMAVGLRARLIARRWTPCPCSRAARSLRLVVLTTQSPAYSPTSPASASSAAKKDFEIRRLVFGEGPRYPSSLAHWSFQHRYSHDGTFMRRRSSSRVLKSLTFVPTQSPAYSPTSPALVSQRRQSLHSYRIYRPLAYCVFPHRWQPHVRISVSCMRPRGPSHAAVARECPRPAPPPAARILCLSNSSPLPTQIAGLQPNAAPALNLFAVQMAR